MDACSTRFDWRGYALVGRPDFLNYLHAGDVTWDEAWEFYRDNAADPYSIVRLMGLFHMFLSQQFDAEGCVLDHGTGVHAELQGWARLALDLREILPEEQLRDSLAALLGQSLISPLYYEAAFSVYVETSLSRHVQVWASDLSRLEKFAADPAPEPRDRHLSLKLSGLPRCPELQAAARWDQSLSVVVGQHYAAWNHAYAVALGEEEEGWQDEGSGG